MQNEELLTHVRARWSEFHEEEQSEESDLGEVFLDSFVAIPRADYKIDEIFDETYSDLETVVDFLEEMQRFPPTHDDKLKELVKLLTKDAVLKKHKVIIFTEFMTTARYLKKQLLVSDIKGVDEIDGDSKRNRADVIQEFAPYDLHWNPVRLMQRMGRVDRRMNPAVEKQLVADHPGEAALRGKVAYWNFLPPDDLGSLLRLYKRVAFKTLRISKVLGIEGKRLLTPSDDFDALRDFTHIYEGEASPAEQLHLEYQKLLRENPALEPFLNSAPLRLFSGKEHLRPETHAVFFCYRLPAEDKTLPSEDAWEGEAGRTGWYIYNVTSDSIVEDSAAIAEIIRSTLKTPRHCVQSEETLREIRLKVEKHIKNTYLKQVQAPIGVRAVSGHC